MLKKLREPEPRSPMQVRQRRKDGSETRCRRSPVIASNSAASARSPSRPTTCRLKRKIEAQLLEKQQHLDHLAHHDQLTGLPNRLFLRRICRRPSRPPRPRAACSRCCSSISIASSTSTIRAATRPATSC